MNLSTTPKDIELKKNKWVYALWYLWVKSATKKVLHYVVFSPRLLFDPLFVKFSQEKINFFLKKCGVYIGKTSKNYYIMDMKILKRYTKNEVISELLEKCPILKYHNEDDIYYEMVYYGELPLYSNKIIDTSIRLYYNTETKSFYYVARIGGNEKRKEYRCDLWSMEQVIEHFKKDIEKSKKFKEQQKIDKIKEDF